MEPRVLGTEEAATLGRIMYGLAEYGLRVTIAVEHALFGSSDFVKFTVAYYTPNRTTISYTRAFTPTDLTTVSDPRAIIDIIIAGLASENKVGIQLLMKWLDGDVH